MGWQPACVRSADRRRQDNRTRTEALGRPRRETSIGRREALMTQMAEGELKDLGIVLPTPPSPVANYVGFVRTGALLFVSGQICLGADGKLAAKGKLGDNVSIEDGQKAARA